MKTSTILVGIVILLAIGGFFAFSGSGKEDVSVSGDSVNNLEGVQKVVLSTKNLNYYPSEIKVKAGEPVSITLDKSVQGCLRSFTIKELGVSEYSSNPSKTIDFTPNKKGTFTFACSMGMGYGKIIVE